MLWFRRQICKCGHVMVYNELLCRYICPVCDLGFKPDILNVLYNRGRNDLEQIIKVEILEEKEEVEPWKESIPFDQFLSIKKFKNARRSDISATNARMNNILRHGK